MSDTKKLLIVRLASGREVEVPGCDGGKVETTPHGVVLTVTDKTDSYGPIVKGIFRWGLDGAIGWYVTECSQELRADAEAYRAMMDGARDAVTP